MIFNEKFFCLSNAFQIAEDFMQAKHFIVFINKITKSQYWGKMSGWAKLYNFPFFHVFVPHTILFRVSNHPL